MHIARWKGEQELEVVGKICDRCGFRVYVIDDYGEFEEFVRININVGYTTKVFIDGDLMECDFCQYCASEVLRPYLRTTITFEGRQEAISRDPRRWFGENYHLPSGGGEVLFSFLDEESPNDSKGGAN